MMPRRRPTLCGRARCATMRIAPLRCATSRRCCTDARTPEGVAQVLKAASEEPKEIEVELILRDPSHPEGKGRP